MTRDEWITRQLADASERVADRQRIMQARSYSAAASAMQPCGTGWAQWRWCS